MIKTNKMRIACVLLIVALILGFEGCAVTVSNGGDDGVAASEIALGEGEKQFLLTVTDSEGDESTYRINTDKETVGDALLELKIIEGEQGPYGMYIKTVNGITADFSDGGNYWAFYVNGEYATAGVDMTQIDESAVYSLRVQR